MNTTSKKEHSLNTSREEKLPEIYSRIENIALDITQFLSRYLNVVGRPTEGGSLSERMRYMDLDVYIKSLNSLTFVETLEMKLNEQIADLDENSQRIIRNGDALNNTRRAIEDAKYRLSHLKNAHSTKTNMADIAIGILS